MSDIASLSGSDLLKLYNETATRLDRPLVKRFSDRKTALRRTQELLASADAEKPAPPAPPPLKLTAKKPRPNFNFPPGPKLRPMREGTLRALFADALKNGATIPQLAEIVEKFDKARGKEPNKEKVRDHVYGAVRLLHFYCGHGIQHDHSTGVLRLAPPQ